MADPSRDGKRVLASGVFDVIHPGHLHYLNESKALGDRLVVVITSDAHAAASKRHPHHSAAVRLKVVQALAPVDEALVGSNPYDLVATARAANPDIITLGYDQDFHGQTLQAELAAAGIRVDVKRISKYPGKTVSTSEYLPT